MNKGVVIKKVSYPITELAIKTISRKKVILDLGSGNKYQGSLRGKEHLFAHSKYFAMDIQCPHDEKPHLLGDIQCLPFKDVCAGGIFVGSVIGLVPEPQKAVDEIYRVLEKNGIVYMSLPFLWPHLHHKDYKDYYRFTEDGIFWLFRKFSKIIITNEGEGYLVTALRFMGGFPIFSRFKVNLWHDKSRFKIIAIISYLERILRKLLGKRYEDLFGSSDQTAVYNIIAKK